MVGRSAVSAIVLLALVPRSLLARDRCEIAMPASVTEFQIKVVKDGRPAGGRHAKLHLRNKLIENLLTNSEGRLAFHNLPVGNYTLSIQSWEDVTLVVHASDVRFPVDEFTLEASSGKCPSLVAGID